MLMYPGIMLFFDGPLLALGNVGYYAGRTTMQENGMGPPRRHMSIPTLGAVV